MLEKHRKITLSCQIVNLLMLLQSGTFTIHRNVIVAIDAATFLHEILFYDFKGVEIQLLVPFSRSHRIYLA